MFITTAWNASIARIVPGSAMPVTATGVCGLGKRSFSNDWMTNTSPGLFTASCPTEVKIGAAIRPISSCVRTCGDGTIPTQ